MLLLLAACQEPFGADRHDLVGFRIAAVSVPPAAPGDEVVPRAAVVVDGRAWSPSPIDLAWYWVDDTDEIEAIDPLTVADAAGPSPLLTVPDRPILAVVARRGSEDRRAFVEVAPPPATIAAPTAFALDPGPTVEPGETVRLRADTDGLVRWMATAGTFTEIDEQTADWRSRDPGPVTVVALALGEPGEATFAATDLHVGDPGPGLWVGQRWLPTDVALEPGEHVRGTLAADDASPCGLRLTAPEVVPGPEDAAYDCLVPLDGTFDPGWLLEQRCGRDALAGDDVVVRVGP